ncbi:molecular chaperone TorD [Methylobacterium frigidaeris]|uniref:Chaperone protein TorD n=2 Tax=Methylobacterium frigidaeris TaxID=2038277 RepID=A0AA37HBC8_9HYPH|nr:molecular chaperone TorD [Methylobacterium frigidaeris]GJD62877.1 Chaperone protein TorD [Methylobacterium frigidaeris]
MKTRSRRGADITLREVMVNQEPDPVDEIDALRAQEYDLLAALLGRAPSQDLLTTLQNLDGDATPIGQAHAALGRAAREAEMRAVGRDYFALFIGVGRGLIMPYASYYLTGFLNERPLARVRQDFATLGLERDPASSEPEDHAATLLEVMAALAAQRLPAEAGADHRFFERHLKPWIGRFFTDVAAQAGTPFYRAVGELGEVFTTVEAEAFAMEA